MLQKRHNITLLSINISTRVMLANMLTIKRLNIRTRIICKGILKIFYLFFFFFTGPLGQVNQHLPVRGRLHQVL